MTPATPRRTESDTAHLLVKILASSPLAACRFLLGRMITVFSFSRLLLAPLLIVGTMGTIGLTYPGGLKAALEDFKHYAEYEDSIKNSLTRESELDQACQKIANRIATKDGLIDEYLARQITFPELVHQFYQMNKDEAEIMHRLRMTYPGCSDWDCLARNVLDYLKVNTRVSKLPDHVKIVERSLCDYQEFIGSSSR
jgi:hypothetical protein